MKYLTRPRNEFVMRTILCIVIFSTAQTLYGGEQIASNKEMKKHEARLHLDGQIVDCINLAFNDFVKDKSDQLRKTKYYTFTIEEQGDLMYIEIHFNHELLKKELNLAFKGGGSRYEIDKKHFAIRDKIIYK